MKIRHLRPVLNLRTLGHTNPRLLIKVGGGCLAPRSQITADPVLLAAIVQWIIHLWRDGRFEIILVVSAPGGKTDHLIAQAARTGITPKHANYAETICQGETDMANELATAINQALNATTDKPIAVTYDARAMGLKADHDKTIRELKHTGRLLSTVHTRKGIAVCAGFQALDPSGRIIDLGRGGSDASAVAIAAALQCDLCVVLKDVPQVYVAPPQLVPKARSLPFVSFSTMYALAATGSKVLMARAVAMAERHNLPLFVCLCPGFPGADDQTEGTLIWSQPQKRPTLEQRGRGQLGLGTVADLAAVTLTNLTDKPGTLATIFGKLQGIVLSEVAQSMGQEHPSVTLTFDRVHEQAVTAALQEHPAHPHVISARDLSSLTLVGSSLTDGPGFIHRLTAALGHAQINIVMLSTSEHGITVLVKKERLAPAAQAVAAAFDLLQTV